MAAEPFYLGAGSARRFCLYHGPATGVAPCGAVVYIHPFAEEMNKSRRMAALQSRALASAGWAVLQIDLAGCGESAGDFRDAAWDAWLEDVELAVDWLAERAGFRPWLWGLRGGCLVAVEAARKIGGGFNFLFWQPVLSGKQHLQQFLRLKLAGELVRGDSRGASEELSRAMAAGEIVEVAGYDLAPALTDGLAAAALTPPGRAGRVIWFEVSTREGATLAPAALKQAAAWTAAGYRVATAVTAGPGFWQTVEVEEAPDLVAASLDALEESCRG